VPSDTTRVACCLSTAGERVGVIMGLDASGGVRSCPSAWTFELWNFAQGRHHDLSDKTVVPYPCHLRGGGVVWVSITDNSYDRSLVCWCLQAFR
jgi:hypothetical protein